MTDSLTFDEKVFVACILAEYKEPVVTEESGRMVHTYDAIGWASFDSVEGALTA